MKNMKPESKLSRVPLAVSIHWRYLHQDQKKTWKEIAALKKYAKYSKATICRHTKRPIGDDVIDKWKNNKGRPPKRTARDKRIILRQVEILRRDYGYFTTKRLKVFAGVSPEISDETVRRVMRAAGYRYLHSRKKGVLSRKDLNIRYKFAKKVRKLLAPTDWKDGIAFYLDGVGFTHKVNRRHWHQERWPGEGLGMVSATIKQQNAPTRAVVVGQLIFWSRLPTKEVYYVQNSTTGS